MKKLSYYIADAGFLSVKICVCFSDKAFQQAIQNAKITTKHNALELGIAESHYIQQEGTQYSMMGVVFNFDEMNKLDALERMGIIYHEVSHTVTHIFQYIGEDETKIGDETRSYLGEYLFKQIFAIYATEEDKRERAGKRDRKTLDKTSQEIVGALLQMAVIDNGGSGSPSIPQSESIPSGAKNVKGSFKSKTSARIRRSS
jgi:hypothetical protein